MKKLLSLLAVAALMPVAANADVLKNVDINGEIQTIASDVKNNADAISGAAWYNRGARARVLAGLSADLVEDVTANVLFQYADRWGDDGMEGKNMDSYWNSIYVANANVVLHNLFCAFELTVGRQFYGDEDSAVMYIGPNHYNAEINTYVPSVDAAKLVYSDDVKTFTMIAGTMANPSYLGPDEKHDLYGADLKLNITDNLKAQVYGYDMTTHGTGADPADDQHTGFYGAKLALDGAVRMSAEYARNFGGDRLIKEHSKAHGGKGQMIKVDAATDIKAVTVRGTFYYANENFFALGNYTPGLLVGHVLGGQIYDYSADGVALFNLGFDMKPADKWTVSLDGYSFQDHRMKHSSTWEADLTAKYAHNENVELFAGVGYAKYGNAEQATTLGLPYKDAFGSENYKGQLGMLIKF